jgi:hypothetical protein
MMGVIVFRSLRSSRRSVMATICMKGGVYLSRAGGWYDGGECVSLLALITAERDGYYLREGRCFALSGRRTTRRPPTQGVALGWYVRAPLGQRVAGAGPSGRAVGLREPVAAPLGQRGAGAAGCSVAGVISCCLSPPFGGEGEKGRVGVWRAPGSCQTAFDRGKPGRVLQ